MKPTLPNMSMKLYIPCTSVFFTKYRGSHHDRTNSMEYVKNPTASSGNISRLSGMVSPMTEAVIRQGHDMLMMKFDSLRSKSPPISPLLFARYPATTSSRSIIICVMMLSIDVSDG